MNYPGDFNTSAFPAGRRIAVSRFMAIGAMTAFFLAACACVLIVWASHSRRIDPYVVSVDALTGEWSLIGRTADDGHDIEFPMQQAVVTNFVQSWLSFSDRPDENTPVWAACDRDTCSGGESLGYGDRECAIFCGAGDELYSAFIASVMPEYQLRAASQERWVLDRDMLRVVPMATVNDNGGMWRINATVQSNLTGEFQVLAFARVARAPGMYPLATGYYIVDFNAYRID